MAHVTFFHYIHNDTLLHRMDGRLKLLCLLLLTASFSFASEWHHGIISLCVAGCALIVSKLPVLRIVKELRMLAVMIAIVIVISGLNIPGDPLPYVSFSAFSIQGVVRGVHFAYRIILIMMMATIMAGTTPLTTIKNAIQWYLKPIPFIPEVRIAMIINLTFVLIPMIFDNYLEMMEAQKARCIELRKNPITRIKLLLFPLLNLTFRKADTLIYAMESRCYCENQTAPSFKTSLMDWVILGISITVLIVMLMA